jgi:hypothetical protein
MRRRKIWYYPGSVGCAVCGAKDKGSLASPWFGSFGNLWCTACLYIGGKISLTYSELKTLDDLGHLKSSMQAFKDKGIRIERHAF